jgi:hypothetical protein
MARSFNGTSDIIKSTTPFTTATNSITLAAWFNRTGGTSGIQIIFINGSGQSNDGYCIVASNADGKFYGIISGVAFMSGSATYSTNTWHHGLITADGASPPNWGLYFDGVNIGGRGPSTASTPTAVSAGAESASGNFFPGNVADAAVWTATLTQLEITALASGVRPNRIRPRSLAGWWPLDGLRSPEPDLSGFVHNGTLTGTAAAFGPPFAPFTPRWPMGAILPVPAPTFILMPQIVM